MDIEKLMLENIEKARTFNKLAERIKGAKDNSRLTFGRRGFSVMKAKRALSGATRIEMSPFSLELSADENTITLSSKTDRISFCSSRLEVRAENSDMKFKKTYSLTEFEKALEKVLERISAAGTFRLAIAII